MNRPITTLHSWHNTLYQQLAIDFCCKPENVADSQNYFTVHQFLKGRRTYHEKEECYLKIAVINGKLLFSGRPDILAWCEEQHLDTGGEWFFEAKNMHRLNERFSQDGYQIAFAHPFFIPENTDEIDGGDYEICWYDVDTIGQFRGDSRYKNAYGFCEKAPDVLGVAAIRNGNILGMAGASCDSPTMWQIGIDVDPVARRQGVGKMLVSMLKNEILGRGILPFYGTGMSHFASQNVALGAGFKTEWAELVTSKVSEQEN
ncbi:MAG: GNAT family N-acetyltransferase [Parasporobacterium sp.]|nr:GNAT family N-acetyltransferase [Parasporobacterium sp.]